MITIGIFWTKFFAHFPRFFGELLWAARMTILITLGALVLAAALGLFLVFLRRSPFRLLQWLAGIYVEVVRGIPALVVLFIIYFGLPDVGIRLDSVTAAIVGLGMNGAAYLSEVFRGAIESIHPGQIEAAKAIGMTRAQAMRHIILPQAAVVAIPAVGNYSIGLFKDTAIVSTIAAPEIMLRARNLISETFLGMQVYLVVALLYLAMSYPLSLGVRWLEKHLGKGMRSM